MHEGVLRCDIENLEWNILDGPDNHGSKRMVKESSGRPGEGGNGDMGANVRRNEASLFRCLTVKDIFKSRNQKVEKIGKAHSIETVRPQGTMNSPRGLTRNVDR